MFQTSLHLSKPSKVMTRNTLWILIKDIRVTLKEVPQICTPKNVPKCCPRSTSVDQMWILQYIIQKYFFRKNFISEPYKYQHKDIFTTNDNFHNVGIHFVLKKYIEKVKKGVFSVETFFWCINIFWKNRFCTIIFISEDPLNLVDDCRYHQKCHIVHRSFKFKKKRWGGNAFFSR